MSSDVVRNPPIRRIADNGWAEYAATQQMLPGETKFKFAIRTKREWDELQAQAEEASRLQYQPDIDDLKAQLDGDSTYVESDYGKAVDEACASITFEEVFEALQSAGIIQKTEKPVRSWSGDSNKFSCPEPTHTDKIPSAWGSRDKLSDKGNAGVWSCPNVCGTGGDKFTLAGYLYGLTTSRADFHKLCNNMARDFRGVKESNYGAAPLLQPKIPAPIVVEDQNEPEDTESTDDETKFPSYDLKAVLPNRNTFLDLYCAEALKATVPVEFPLWAGLAALSLALGRSLALKHIEIPTYANLAICLTGASTSGKGRTMRGASSIIRAALPYDDTPVMSGLPPQGVQVLQLPGSGEKLVEELDIALKGVVPAGSPKGTPAPVIKRFSPPTLVEFEEMQTLVSKSSGISAYKSYILQFADTVDHIGRNSSAHGSSLARNSYVTFLTSTQPRHLRDQFTKRDEGSGLLNRFIFPFGKAVPKSAWGFVDQDWLLAKTALQIISAWVGGLQTNNPSKDAHWIYDDAWDDDARDMWIKHFETVMDPDERGPHSDLLGRMSLNMLRLILLFAANEMSDRIRLSHVQSAFALYDYIRDCALNLAREIRTTEMSDTMKMVLDSVKHLETKLKRPPTRKHLFDKWGRNKMNDEEFAVVTQKLMNARLLFFVRTESRTGRGRKGEAYTSSLGLWDSTSSVAVTPVSTTTHSAV